MKKKVYIIGGGPAGMMAAYSAKKHFPETDVILLERNERLGKKLGFTGGGRCNVCANTDIETIVKHVVKNGNFLYSALHSFGPQEIISFFEEQNCPLKEEDHHRMFPKDDQAKSIIAALEGALKQVGVKVYLACFVESIDEDKRLIMTNQGKFGYDKLILATGGKVLPGSGSDGHGYSLAKQLGHSMTELLPAEVPLVSNDRFIQEKLLQGLSFQDINLKLLSNAKVKQTICHDLLITHFGLSGPAALRMSFYVQKALEKEKPVYLAIDFCPNLSESNLNEKTLPEIKELLPKRLASYIESQVSSKGDFIKMMKHFKVSVYETRGFSYAFVTNGGVNLKEIDPKTMRSKLKEDLSFCGELMDISAFTGGYNITSAFSSGYAAGRYIF